MPKVLYWMGVVMFCVLVLMAVLLYKERTAFIDIAYHLFFILKDGEFAIQNYRFVAAGTQVFPLVGSMLGLPLDVIMKLYSVAFPLVFFGCYLVCGVWMKDKKGALLLLFTTLLFTTDTFYWIQSELQQGLAFLVVLFCWIYSYRGNAQGLFWIITACLCATVVFAHPLLLFPLAYGFLFFALIAEDVTLRKRVVITFAFTAVAWLAKKFVFTTSYDDSAMGNLRKFITFFPDYFTLSTNKEFLKACVSKFYAFPIFLFVVVFYYFRQRQWRLLFLLLAFTGGYLLLINVSYEATGATAYYMENMYLPLSIFVGLPMVYLVLSHPRMYSLASILIVLMVVGGVFRIWFFREPYVARLAWMQSLLQQHGNEKLVIDEQDIPKEKLMMTWGTPYEFWLLSTSETGKTASIVITENAAQLNWTMDRKDAFVTVWGVFPYEEFGNNYFRFTDTIDTYQRLH
ncbi:MAG TPA: hypothetical protein PL009_06770 [Flavipsychrobacter sp.]|nr:hypothetical protein [Flavipsychrobacter sp.]